jgi:hypothetical protein
VFNTKFALERITVKFADVIAPAILQALETRGINFFLVDAPAEAFKAALRRGARPRRAAVQRHGAGGFAAPRGLRARSCTRS